MHLECAAGNAAGNIVEADNGVTDIKRIVCDIGPLTAVVDT